MSAPTTPPFPWFGGKRRTAGAVWRRFGDVPNYVEAFFGAGAVLLGRPHAPRTETVNDLDGFVCNFFRAVKADPEAVAHHADWLVSECDLHARHAWLVGQRKTLSARLEGDPDFCDAKIAGWWVWGVRLWIGSGWCFANGPWHVEDGMLVSAPRERERGIRRQLPKIGGAFTARSRTSPAQRHPPQDPQDRRNAGGMDFRGGAFNELAERLAAVRITCGDWSRVVTPAVTWQNGTTGVLLDPPYSHEDRESGLYSTDASDVAARCREWALENGDDPRLRIALCGYDGEHDMPPGWTAHRWKAVGGYGVQRKDGANENADRETVWFSPHCLKPRRVEQMEMWEETS